MPNIIITGAGFGGILTIKKLIRKLPNYNFTLIDPKDYFLFTPRLADLLNHARKEKIAIKKINDIFGKYKNFQFIKNKAEFINFKEKFIQAKNKKINYDYLVLSCGAKPNFFNCKGAEENCLQFKEYEDIKKIENHVSNVLKKAEKTKGLQRKSLLNFVVIGGGATGIELVFEFQELIYKLAKNYNINKEEIKITIIHSRDKIVPYFDERIIKKATKELERKKINVIYNSKATEIRPDEIIMDKKKIKAQTVIWVAGIQTNTIKISPEINYEKGKIPINESLQLKGNVFSVGDCSTNIENPLPQTAQIARQQALHLSKNILRKINNKKMLPFNYKMRGEMLFLGHEKTVVKAFNFVFDGFLGNLFRHIYYWILFKEYTAQ